MALLSYRNEDVELGKTRV